MLKIKLVKTKNEDNTIKANTNVTHERAVSKGKVNVLRPNIDGIALASRDR